jgi:hypothetical protein
MGALMPTFDTPEPVEAHIDLAMGDVRIIASDRSDAVVDVRPSDASDEEDRKAAELTRVHHAHGHLIVRGPKLRSWLSRRGGGSIDVTLEVPTGSGLHGAAGAADFACDGALGDVRIRTGAGHIRLDRVGSLSVKSGSGDITVDRATRNVEITSASGDVRLRELDASAVVKNSNGDTWIGVAAGDLKVNAANGPIVVDLARGTTVAKSANGDVRLREVVRGSVVLETTMGDLEVGVGQGTAAHLDVSAVAGHVHNDLEATSDPGGSAQKVEVRARTTMGDIAIRRRG